ncbi:hypothetical protein TIFTF001_020172 [Ficus carica]|uniref:Uncharacterized protein n=1 Tax=Ficus carica TaxID=3494 RepID=A0AA88AED9_FICCA|nr:hypothetical protein TIFTF001_020172 [Ficus carica]
MGGGGGGGGGWGITDRRSGADRGPKVATGGGGWRAILPSSKGSTSSIQLLVSQIMSMLRMP